MAQSFKLASEFFHRERSRAPDRLPKLEARPSHKEQVYLERHVSFSQTPNSRLKKSCRAGTIRTARQGAGLRARASHSAPRARKPTSCSFGTRHLAREVEKEDRCSQAGLAIAGRWGSIGISPPPSSLPSTGLGSRCAGRTGTRSRQRSRCSVFSMASVKFELAPKSIAHESRKQPHVRSCSISHANRGFRTRDREHSPFASPFSDVAVFRSEVLEVQRARKRRHPRVLRTTSLPNAAICASRSTSASLLPRAVSSIDAWI